MHLWFLPVAEIEHQPNRHFLALDRFCLASLQKARGGVALDFGLMCKHLRTRKRPYIHKESL